MGLPIQPFADATRKDAPGSSLTTHARFWDWAMRANWIGLKSIGPAVKLTTPRESRWILQIKEGERLGASSIPDATGLPVKYTLSKTAPAV